MLRASYDLKKLAELEDALEDLRSMQNRTDYRQIVQVAFGLAPFEAREAVAATLDAALAEEIAKSRKALAKKLSAEPVN